MANELPSDNVIEIENLAHQARDPFEGQLLRIMRSQAAQMSALVALSQRNLNEVMGLRGDVSTMRDEIQVFEEAAKDARRIALRAESSAEMARNAAEMASEGADRKVRRALDTLPDAIEVQRIAREAADAAATHAVFEATETPTGRIRNLVEKERERPLASDPVRAIVAKELKERERDALVARVQWWQSTALKWVLGGAAGGATLIHFLEQLLSHH